MEFHFPGGTVFVKSGDITNERVDAIVNAANSSLMGGAGVDGAIHSKGGVAILKECREIRQTSYPNGLPTGKAVITTAGDLPAKHVIHTVGPVFGQNSGNDSDLLARAYTSCLSLAAKHQLRSISFPSISTGAYGFPKDAAAEISSLSIRAFLMNYEQQMIVNLVFFSAKDFELFGNHHKF